MHCFQGSLSVMRIRRHLQAPAWAIFLGIATICAQGSSAWAEAAKIVKAKKPPSVCVGLDESACGGKAECYWRKVSTTKAGKTRRAHCRIRRSATRNAPGLTAPIGGAG
jgi:hypothetical protein